MDRLIHQRDLALSSMIDTMHDLRTKDSRVRFEGGIYEGLNKAINLRVNLMYELKNLEENNG